MAGEIDYMAVSAADFPLKQRELAGRPFTVFMAQPTQPTPSPGMFQLADQPQQALPQYGVPPGRSSCSTGSLIEEVYNGLAIPGAGLVLPSNKASGE